MHKEEILLKYSNCFILLANGNKLYPINDEQDHWDIALRYINSDETEKRLFEESNYKDPVSFLLYERGCAMVGGIDPFLIKVRTLTFSSTVRKLLHEYLGEGYHIEYV